MGILLSHQRACLASTMFLMASSILYCLNFEETNLTELLRLGPKRWCWDFTPQADIWSRPFSQEVTSVWDLAINRLCLPSQPAFATSYSPTSVGLQ